MEINIEPLRPQIRAYAKLRGISEEYAVIDLIKMGIITIDKRDSEFCESENES